MGARDVDYTLEIVENLPDLSTSRRSPLEDQIDRIVNEPRSHGKFVRIGSYGNGSAASAAASALRRKHGDTPKVDGFEIRVRRADKDGQPRTGVFVNYDPGRRVPGELEAFQERVRDKERAKEARKKAKREAAVAEAMGTGTPGAA